MAYYGLPTEPWEQVAHYLQHGNAAPMAGPVGGADPYNPPREFASPAHAIQWCENAGWSPRGPQDIEYPGASNPRMLAEYLLKSQHRHHQQAQQIVEYGLLEPWAGCGGVVLGEHDVPAAQKLIDLAGLTRTHTGDNKLGDIGYWIAAAQTDGQKPHSSGMWYGVQGIHIADNGLLACLEDPKNKATVDWVRTKASALFSHYQRNANLSNDDWKELALAARTARHEEGYSPTAHLEYLLTKYGLSGFSQTWHDIIPRLKNTISGVRDERTWNELLDMLRGLPHLMEYELDIGGISLECKAGIMRILYNVEHLNWQEAQPWISRLSAQFQQIDAPTQRHLSYDRLIGSHWKHREDGRPQMYTQQRPVQMPATPQVQADAWDDRWR